jgi:hypothetical protein
MCLLCNSFYREKLPCVILNSAKQHKCYSVAFSFNNVDNILFAKSIFPRPRRYLEDSRGRIVPMQDRLGVKSVLCRAGNRKKVNVHSSRMWQANKIYLPDPRETPLPHKGSCTVSEWACRRCSSWDGGCSLVCPCMLLRIRLPLYWIKWKN